LGNLASDTAVQHLADNRFTATLSPDWHLLVPNGGYLAAIALRTAQRLTELARPTSLSCQFLAPARFGRVELTGTVLRRNSRATALRISMTQGNEHLVEALVWAAPADGDSPAIDWHPMPVVPGPEEFRDLRDQLTVAHAWVPRWHDSVNLRVVSGSEAPRFTWARFRPVPTFTQPWLDACRSLILVDSLQWPAIRESLPGSDRTLALTMHLAVDFHAGASDSEWLLVDARGSAAAQGFAGGVATVWSSDGRMIASGLQHMLLHKLSRPAAFARR